MLVMASLSPPFFMEAIPFCSMTTLNPSRACRLGFLLSASRSYYIAAVFSKKATITISIRRQRFAPSREWNWAAI